MKMTIFVILLVYSKLKSVIDLDIINLEKYGDVFTNFTNAGICLEIKGLDNNKTSYIDFHSKDGWINKTIKYEYLNISCYTNYTYDPENTSLNSLEPDSRTLYEEEFTYEYKFRKEPNSKYFFFIYTQYNGTKLSIIHLHLKSKTILFIILGSLGGFIILLIIICFCCYKCCKRVNKTNFDNQYKPIL